MRLQANTKGKKRPEFGIQPLCGIGRAGRKIRIAEKFRADSVVHNQKTMALLWNPESWPQRLAELEAQTGDLKEAPLRRDVRSLGTLLGAVLREQAGDELFAQVEALRQGTIRRRDAEARGNAEEAARQATTRNGAGALASGGTRHPAHARLCVLL